MRKNTKSLKKIVGITNAVFMLIARNFTELNYMARIIMKFKKQVNIRRLYL